MRKYIYNVVIILFVLQMSHVQVFANYEKEDVATAHSIETLQSLINKEVMHLSSEFSIRYTGDLAEIKDELTEITKMQLKTLIFILIFQVSNGSTKVIAIILSLPLHLRTIYHKQRRYLSSKLWKILLHLCMD